MEDVGGARAVRALQAQGQAGGGLAIQAGFCGLVVIRFTPQFVKPGFCRFKRREMFQRTAVFCVVRPGFQACDDVEAPPAAVTLRYFPHRSGLLLRKLFSRQRPETVHVRGGPDGVVGELPLPRPYAGRPSEAAMPHGRAGIPVRLLVEEHLEPVRLQVHFHLAALEGPALKFRFPFGGQLHDTGLSLPDVGVVVRQKIALIGMGISPPAPGHRCVQFLEFLLRNMK